MTVNEMIMLSRVFLGMMIFFLIAAIVAFFFLDVRKAWRILTGKKVPVQQRKKEHVKGESKNDKNNGLISKELKTKRLAMESVGVSRAISTEESVDATTVLGTMESVNNQYEGYHPTTVLMDRDGETTVLTNQNDSRNDIVTDITFVHTEVTL